MAENTNANSSSERVEDLEKVLAMVIKQRQIIPKKCMELNKRSAALELQLLQNAAVVSDKNGIRENFKRVIQGARLNPTRKILADLNTAENKLQQCYKQTKDISSCLSKIKSNKF